MGELESGRVGEDDILSAKISEISGRLKNIFPADIAD
jgi:hypothetical protein